jgi:DNA polymerase sigma
MRRRGCTAADRNRSQAALLSLAKSLRFQHDLPAFAVLGARVPVVRVCDRRSGLAADISLDNRAAVAHTHLLGVFAAVDPRVKPLVLLVKAWARRRRINSASAGTLSSFALTLLVIHFLQAAPPPLPHRDPRIPQAAADARTAGACATAEHRAVGLRFDHGPRARHVPASRGCGC